MCILLMITSYSKVLAEKWILVQIAAVCHELFSVSRHELMCDGEVAPFTVYELFLPDTTLKTDQIIISLTCDQYIDNSTWQWINSVMETLFHQLKLKYLSWDLLHSTKTTGVTNNITNGCILFRWASSSLLVHLNGTESR